jgi:hypothetical protein
MGLTNNLFVVGLFRIRNHGFLSGLPVGWADFSVLISVLEGLDESQILIGISSDWQVID